ncbi:MAG: DJ-1/PfpI family protein [Clostridiales bacterium]|nr:DJ-1/PfpI family protein [Clostridiales bacterium]
MSKSYLFLADGFEEIEALATLDMLRRAGMNVETVSINADGRATGAHGVTVVADTSINEAEQEDIDWLILPGGLPGASNLVACGQLVDMLRSHNANDGHIAAICASPAYVLGALGLLEGVTATCYPGCEGMAPGVEFTFNPVEVSGNIITGKGPGYTFKFAEAIIVASMGRDVADTVLEGMLP